MPQLLHSEEKMTVQIEGVPLNRVLSFPFSDRQAFRRFLLAAGLTLAGFLIPVLPGLFVSGYSIRILRLAIREGKVEMPDWSGENQLLMDGIYSTIISLAYILPGLITLIGGFILYIISFVLVIPSPEQADATSVFGIFIPMFILFASMALGLALLMLSVIPLPVALCRFADEGRLGAAFNFREIFGAVKKNPLGYIAALVVCFGLMYILYFFYLIAYMTVILCCPGYLIMLAGIPAAGIIYLAMVGLAYRQGKTA
jgi:hypothetical protein